MRSLTRIGRRLALGVGLVVALSSLAGVFGIRAGADLSGRYDALFARNAAESRAANDARTFLVAMQRHLKDAALATDPDRTAAALALADAEYDSAAACLAVLGRAWDGHPQTVRDIEDELAAWRFGREWVASLKDVGSDRQAADIAQRHAGPIEAEIEAGVLTLATGIADAHRDRSAALIRRQRATNQRLTLLLLVTSVLAAALGLGLARSLVRPLHRIGAFADDIRNGRLDRRLDLGRADEIGAVADALDGMAAALQTSRADLVAHRAELERRVTERTEELVRAHEILNVEFNLRESIAQQLMESEERLDLMITGTADGFWDWPDLSDETMWWSPKAFDLLDLDPKEVAPGLGLLLATADPEDRASLEGALRFGADGGARPDLEFRARCDDGSTRWLHLRGQVFRDDDGHLRRMAGSLQDIDDRKWAEAQLIRQNDQLETLNRRLRANQNQLIQSEKMSSLGQLAAGIAHEINNPVGYISSNLGTMAEYAASLRALLDPLLAAMRDDAPDHAAVRRQLERLLADEDYAFVLEDIENLLDESREGTERISVIVNSLKSFARPDEDNLVEADINEGLETALRMVWNHLKYKCEVEKDLSPLPPVCCNIGRLNQVFMNLLVNAADAIERDGRILVSTAHRDGHVVITVQDNGSGVPPEMLDRIFEPFYTTKPVGQGTGLGLSISHGIVSDHRGTITVDSSPGTGTAFTIRIPDDLHPIDDAPDREAAAAAFLSS